MEDKIRKSEYNKKYRSEHLSEVRETQREWKKNNQDKVMSSRRKYQMSLYGITPEEYDRLFELQGGKCAICGSDKPRSNRKSFNVDHDHNTGRVRGLLCLWCNSLLGLYEKNPSLFTQFYEYLKR